MTPKELEDRLIDYAVLMIKIASLLPKSPEGDVLRYQLTKSGTSPALNYGEAQEAESKNDFIHKMKIGNKELRESSINLRIIDRAKLLKNHSEILNKGMKETNELIAIFTSSIKTARKGVK